MRTRISVLTCGVAIVAAIAPIDPGFVERVYSTGLYAAIQPAVTSLSNRVPFALLDVFAAVIVIILIALTGRDLVRARRAGMLVTSLRIIGRVAVWSAALYLLFLAVWGLNYRRVRLIDKIYFDERAITAQAAAGLAGVTVDEVNALYAQAHAEPISPGVDAGLADAFNAAVRTVGASPASVARPKRTALDWYFRRAAVSGMTDPFFLETLVATDVLSFERPFVVAHEWSHLAGIAHEGDANFLGWVTCLRGAPAHRYSGWLFLYVEIAPSLGRDDRRAVAARLNEGPRADLKAIQERYERNVSPRISAAGWRIYDSYLKANRVEGGAASYQEVVRLVLGTRFSSDWTPVRRETP